MFIKKILSVICFLLVCYATYAQNSSSDFSSALKIANGEYFFSTTKEKINAQYNLGIMYLNGTGGAPKNLEKAAYWFAMAANAGNKYAQYYLGFMYFGGHGVAKNIEKAKFWFEKSSSQIHPGSSLYLGWIYNFGWGTSINKEKAVRFYKDAAFGGIPMAMYYYAKSYALGEGVKCDSTKAILWAKRAIEAEYYDAYYLLGNMYRLGWAVGKVPYLARMYYEKGAELNNSECQLALGDAYYDGTIYSQDYDKAIHYYTLSADNGNQSSMRRLVYLYCDVNEYKNYPLAIDFALKLYNIDKSDIDALIYSYRKNDNHTELIPLLKERGSASDYNELAYIYAKGEGVPINYKLAIEYVDKAITLSNKDLDYIDSKGEILFISGNIKKAKKVWNEINSKDPTFYENFIKDNGYEPPFYMYMKNIEK